MRNGLRSSPHFQRRKSKRLGRLGNCIDPQYVDFGGGYNPQKLRAAEVRSMPANQVKRIKPDDSAGRLVPCCELCPARREAARRDPWQMQRPPAWRAVRRPSRRRQIDANHIATFHLPSGRLNLESISMLRRWPRPKPRVRHQAQPGRWLPVDATGAPRSVRYRARQDECLLRRGRPAQMGLPGGSGLGCQLSRMFRSYSWRLSIGVSDADAYCLIRRLSRQLGRRGGWIPAGVFSKRNWQLHPCSGHEKSRIVLPSGS